MKPKRVCPVSEAGVLDNLFRKIIHNPKRILGDYIKKGMVVLDAGCGPGFFSVEMAEMVGKSGKVIAADLQEGMLDKLRKKIKGNEIEKRIELHKSGKDRLGVSEKVDFVLAFYVVHELPDQKKFFKEIHRLLKKNGKIFVIEPVFHVSRKEYKETINTAISAGFNPITEPKVLLGRATVLRK
jgi:ubiquinone/menaquinone biosynthesis C-methylase UbiE